MSLHGLRMDLTGQRFSRLVVTAPAERDSSGTRWYVRCDCGTEKIVRTTHLRNGKTLSCGCLSQQAASARRRTHGKTRTRVYRIWRGMHTRCTNPNVPCWPRYGGRGIYVCDRWQSFENFFADMGQPPSSTHEIERIDNDKGYEPSNCKWATRTEQTNNKRSNVFLEYDGRRMTVAQWAAFLGVNVKRFYKRLYLGWSVERTIGEEYRNKPAEGVERSEVTQ